MRAYTVNGISESGTGPKTNVTIIASTAVRPRALEFVIGNQTAPNATDQQFTFALQRFTAAGTAASNPTPLPVDPGDVASVTTAGITHSAEPTYTSTGVIFGNAVNQRASWRWVANPGYEPMAPATSANGFGLKHVSVAVAIVSNGTVMFLE